MSGTKKKPNDSHEAKQAAAVPAYGHSVSTGAAAAQPALEKVPVVSGPAASAGKYAPATTATPASSYTENTATGQTVKETAPATPAPAKKLYQPPQPPVPTPAPGPHTAIVGLQTYDVMTGNLVPIKPRFKNAHTQSIITSSVHQSTHDAIYYALDLSDTTAMVNLDFESPQTGEPCYTPLLRNINFLANGGGHCCSLKIGMATLASKQTMALTIIILEKENAGLRRSYGFPRGCHHVKVSVDPIQPPLSGGTSYVASGGTQTKITNMDGYAEFILQSDHWYEVNVHGRIIEPCGPIHFFACGDAPGELTIYCRPDPTRCLELIFEDECGQRVPDVRFSLSGYKHQADEHGICAITDPPVGLQKIMFSAPYNSAPQEITVGSAEEQKTHIQVVKAATPSIRTKHLLTFAVEGFMEVREEVRIIVLDPKTGSAMHNLTLDHAGAAKCFVDEGVPHDVIFKVGEQVVQRERVTPDSVISKAEESLYV